MHDWTPSVLVDGAKDVHVAPSQAQVDTAFAEARIEDEKGRLVSRSTGTFLIQRD